MKHVTSSNHLNWLFYFDRPDLSKAETPRLSNLSDNDTALEINLPRNSLLACVYESLNEQHLRHDGRSDNMLSVYVQPNHVLRTTSTASVHTMLNISAQLSAMTSVKTNI